MNITLCQGGWCPNRDNCPNYLLGYGAGIVPDSEALTVERLCQGQELGKGQFKDVTGGVVVGDR